MTHDFGSTVIVTMRYDNASEAIPWLCKTFGFKRHLVVSGDEGSIAHAQLTYGNGMIMLSDTGHGAYDALQKTPSQVSGVGTQSPYIIVEDVDAHHARAVEGGAKVVVPLEDQPHGGRAYSCRDPQGHLWNFGSYDPWVSTED